MEDWRALLQKSWIRPSCVNGEGDYDGQNWLHTYSVHQVSVEKIKGATKNHLTRRLMVRANKT